jgi:hypothetical protein
MLTLSGVLSRHVERSCPIHLTDTCLSASGGCGIRHIQEPTAVN